MKRAFLASIIFVLLQSCSISYKFNGASIDYNLTKTLRLANFPNQAPLVYPPLEYQATPYIDILIEEMGYTAGNIKK